MVGEIDTRHYTGIFLSPPCSSSSSRASEAPFVVLKAKPPKTTGPENPKAETRPPQVNTGKKKKNEQTNCYKLLFKRKSPKTTAGLLPVGHRRRPGVHRVGGREPAALPGGNWTGSPLTRFWIMTCRRINRVNRVRVVMVLCRVFWSEVKEGE